MGIIVSKRERLAELGWRLADKDKPGVYVRDSQAVGKARSNLALDVAAIQARFIEFVAHAKANR